LEDLEVFEKYHIRSWKTEEQTQEMRGTSQDPVPEKLKKGHEKSEKCPKIQSQKTEEKTQEMRKASHDPITGKIVEKTI